MEKVPGKKGGWKKVVRVILKVVLGIFLLILVVLLLILTPPVQRFITNRATTWLEKKLGTEVGIGRLFITVSGKVALDDVYLEDQSKDTLFAAGELRVNLSFYDIIFNNELDIKSIRLDDATAKIKRQLPDTSFNFQYIIDAFGSGTTDTVTTDEPTEAMAISIGTVDLNNLRFVYKDVLTGNDVEMGLAHFDTKVEKFDLAKMNFNVPRINIRQLTSTIVQNKPLIIDPEVSKTTAAVSTVPSPVLQLTIGQVSVQKSAVDYTNNVGGMYANVQIGDLDLQPKTIDLANSHFDLGKILLHDSKAIVRMEKSANAKPAVIVDKTNVDTVNDQQAMVLIFSGLDLKSVDIKFDDWNKPAVNKGMDFAHLETSVGTLQMNNFVFNKDSIGASVTDVNFREKSGFVLQQLKTDFLYASNQAFLKNLYIKTPGSEIKRDIAIRYASPQALAADIGNLKVDAQIDNSKILVSDVLAFVPSLQSQPAFANPNATWFLDGHVTGAVNNLNVERLTLAGLTNTRMNLSGTLNGLPDINKMKANLVIHDISSSRKDLLSFMPAGSLPANITFPNRINLSGRINGSMADLLTDLKLRTDLGNVTVKGVTKNITNAKTAGYDLVLTTEQLDLGTILQDDSTYGPVTASFTAKGTGYDPKTADGELKGLISSIIYKRYEYRDFSIEAIARDHQITAKAGIQDPNIHFALDVVADVSGKDPAVKMELMVDSIKAKELNLTPEPLTYHGKINADFPVVNIDSLEGALTISESVLLDNTKRYQVDSIRVVAGKSDSVGRFIHLSSDILYAQLQGIYKLTEMGSVIQRSIDPYFQIAGTDSLNSNQSPYNFTLNADVVNGPVLQAFVPGLERMDSLSLRSHFDDIMGWTASLRAPAITIGTNEIRNLDLEAKSGEVSLDVITTVRQIKSGDAIQLDNVTLTTIIAENIADFTLNIRKAEQDQYNIGGYFRQPFAGVYEFLLRPTGLVLNYDNWTVSPNNVIRVSPDDIHATNFTLTQGSQHLGINSTGPEKNSPLEVAFRDFRIATLTGFVMSDSTLVDGLLNGKAVVTDVTSGPMLNSDLDITDITVKGDTVGNMKALVKSKDPETFNADVTITGKGNDLKLAGDYLTSTGSFDMLLDIRSLPMTTAQALSAGAIRDASGGLNGQFKIKGTPALPDVDGKLNFEKVGFTPSMLNNYFRIDQETIVINNQGIIFDKFEVKDSASNTLTVDGEALTKNFTNFNLDLEVKAKNFRALNSTKKDNKIFYGKLFFDTDLKITGTETNPVIDGRIKVNEKTALTVVLPQNEPGVVEREGIVEFVDMDAPASDSLFLARYDSLNTVDLSGAQVSLNIEIDKAADLTLIVDEGNGDFLNVKGQALLNAGITPGGEISMAGTYELEDGAYNLSFNGIRRKFVIEKGSRITFAGEPTDADLDITAKYVANAAPLDLVKGQLGDDIESTSRNIYLQKLPFEVLLKMEGPLLKPSISFDIQLPSNQNFGVGAEVTQTVQTKLDQLRTEDAEMNKQVFALLLLNRFVAENPFNSSGSGFSAATLARQSVSKLLTEQLNKLASDLVSGVDLNFDVESSEDYSTGQRADRTDLNVGLSKRLLNDRLTVTVGSNFELEGPQESTQQASNIAGNIGVNYALSNDGRYQLRAYRKNEFQGVLEGYVVETGVGFIMTFDYNRFREIIHPKKLERERRTRRERREAAQKAATSATPLQNP
ncbi:MAG: translocation/assembly module TamB domain-containing protein [Chitinophagaceae bacterium]